MFMPQASEFGGLVEQIEHSTARAGDVAAYWRDALQENNYSAS